VRFVELPLREKAIRAERQRHAIHITISHEQREGSIKRERERERESLCVYICTDVMIGEEGERFVHEEEST